MGGKEAENTFSIKIMCISWPAKLRKKVCVVCVLSVAFDVEYFISNSTFEKSS